MSRKGTTVTIRHPKGMEASDEELLEAFRVVKGRNFVPVLSKFRSPEEEWLAREWAIDHRNPGVRPCKFEGPGVCCLVSWEDGKK